MNWCIIKQHSLKLFSKPYIKTKLSDTLPGFYDLGRENVLCVCNISEPPKPKIPSKRSKSIADNKSKNEAHEQRKFLDQSNLKHSVLKNQQIQLVILLIIVLVAAGIGITFFVKGTGMLKSYNCFEDWE